MWSLTRMCKLCSLSISLSFYSFIEGVLVCLLSFSWGKIDFKIYIFLSPLSFIFYRVKRVIIVRKGTGVKIFAKIKLSHISFSLCVCVYVWLVAGSCGLYVAGFFGYLEERKREEILASFLLLLHHQNKTNYIFSSFFLSLSISFIFHGKSWEKRERERQRKRNKQK